ncbi:MAG: hypothetical protein ACJ8BW_20000 [Ktedonobacteraceae bacterium]
MNMRYPVSPSPSTRQEGGEWSQKYLGSQEPKVRAGGLEWWYRLTAPAELPASASLAQRELVRRGRLASTIMFFFVIVLIAVLPIGIFGPNHIIVLVVSTLLCVVVVALLFNRRGKSNITGLIVSVALNLGLFTVIRMSPGGLAPSSLGLFDLLVFTELFVASLLPVNWVFLAAAANIGFIVFDLSTQSRTPLFATVMATDFYPILVRPIALHMVVTIVLWLWVRSATQAIARADRAEVIATLEHAIAEQEHSVAQQKRLLDASIQQIVQTHMRVANGEFNARVPLTPENVLWQVAGSLNNLLSRLQRLRQFELEMQHVLPQLQRMRQSEQELQLTKEEISLLATALHKARTEKRLSQLARSRTALDELIVELNALSQSSSISGWPFDAPLRKPNSSGCL